MKIILDIDQLLNNGEISQSEYDKLNKLAYQAIGVLAFNILIGFGVVAVSLAVLTLVPVPSTAITIGILLFIVGLILLYKKNT